METSPMPGGPDTHARSLGRATTAKAAVAVGILVIAVAILAPHTLTPPTATPGRPTSSTSGSSTAVPEATAESWQPLVVQPYAPIAELTPDDANRVGIATTASFTLRSPARSR